MQAKAKVQSARRNPATTAQKTQANAKKAVQGCSRFAELSNTQGSQNSAAGTKAQGPIVEGNTQLTGLTKGLVNNANNLLLSAAGLWFWLRLCCARTSKKVSSLTHISHRHRFTLHSFDPAPLNRARGSGLSNNSGHDPLNCKPSRTR